MKRYYINKKAARAAMLIKGIRVSDIAEETGISDRRVTRYIDGHQTIKEEELKRIAAALELKPEDLLKEPSVKWG